MSEAKIVSKPITAEESAALDKHMAKVHKFLELATKRTGKAIQAIRLIGNLASPNYAYATEHADKIVSALQTEIDAVYEAFKNKKLKEKVAFTMHG